MLKWVKLKGYCQMSGDTPAEVQRKIDRGMWIDGLQYRIEADDSMSIDIDAVEEWIESGVPPPKTLPAPKRRGAAPNPPPAPPQLEVPTDLYRFYDADGRLLYVGISLSFVARMVAHKGRSHWFSGVKKVERETLPTRSAALQAELEAIRAEAPLHNIAGAK